MSTYIYPISIILMFLLLYESITTAYSYAPKKIKVITIMALFLIVLRYISLSLLLIYEKMQYMYLLKPVIFLEIIYIPMIIFISVNIFARNDKIKMNFFFILCAIFLIVYFIFIIKAPFYTSLSQLYGYSITLKNGIYPYLVLIIANTISFAYGFKIFEYKFNDKVGTFLMIVSSIITIGSVIASVFHENFMGMIILGEIFWVGTLVYGLRKFVK